MTKMTDKEKLSKLMQATEELIDALNESAYDECLDCGEISDHTGWCRVNRLAELYNELNGR